MSDPVPAWTSSDGKVFTDYLKYLKHDLYLWLTKVSENEVGARKIVESLDEVTIEVFMEQIAAIRDELKSPAVFEITRKAA